MDETRTEPKTGAAKLNTGARLGPYVVQRLVRMDAMEEVYRGHDPRLDRDVLVRLATSPIGSDHFKRFVERWRTGALFTHPNVVAVYDFGWHQGQPYLVSELLDGETLRARISAGAFPPWQAATFAMQIADGLNEAHRVRVIHGELRPENIVITRGGLVKVHSFGPPRCMDEMLELVEHTTGGVAMEAAAVAYMAPEQATAATVDHRADIFSLGVIFYEMVTGVAPFRRTSPIETLLAIVQDDLPAVRRHDRGVSLVMDRVIRRCVEKDPGERFQSALDLLSNLENLLPVLREVASARAPAERSGGHSRSSARSNDGYSTLAL